jgi:peroxiredoxin
MKMAATPSKMIELGSKAPDFDLFDVISRQKVSLRSMRSKIATVIMFICNHCPYVKHINQVLVTISREYESRGITFVAINSNDYVAYPEDSPEQMRVVANAFGYPFPYLIDESQDVARAYDAVCTPDLFVYDGDLRLAYRGQFDSSRPGNSIPVTGDDLKSALDAIIDGKQVDIRQMPSVGCSIKWK